MDLIRWRTFTRRLTKRKFDGTIKEFDDEFYKRFEGLYFHGVPIYFYISPAYASGRCYSASAILALAMGDCYIYRGDLVSQSLYWGRDSLGHGWVEKDGYVYDTTWGIYCKADVYKHVFKPKVHQKVASKEFYKSCNLFFDEEKEGLDLEIHDKAWYENNYSSATLSVWETRVYAQKQLEKPDLYQEERDFWQKLLNDLPEEGRVKGPELYIYQKGEE